MLRKLFVLMSHWREAKSAFSTLSGLYDPKNTALEALGSLTDEELHAVCRWATEEPGRTVVEIGTLFGLTACELARDPSIGKVIAVDNFSWNPFGLPPQVHENFTRQILRGSSVQLVNCSSDDWRRQVAGKIDMVFFDASHRYEDVKAECEWARDAKIKVISGHDYGNPNARFGVTRAVDEVFGKDRLEVVGMCWRVRS